jgi:acyl-[acyl-carrier-protein]-phospholipid O-acyltransferase/long-chain-fatty-acid--[acyl-carrier-protein] ligase
MKSNQQYLFKDKRFLPIFIVQFFGCLSDNIIKNALIILITYKLSAELGESQHILVLLANTVFITPFILFGSIAGQVADRYERSTIVKIIKFFEIIIVLIASYGFIINNLFILFMSLALMGIHSSFFGPIKYSVLPDHLTKNELLPANGYIEAGTFISILLGTMIGGFLTYSVYFIIFIAFLSSITGFIATYFMPKSNNINRDVKINFDLFAETIEIIKYAKSKKQVYLAILGISWFWFIGATIFAQIPSFAKDTLGGDANVANLFLAIFSIGVGVGSSLCSKIFENEITAKYTFVSALGISIFGIHLFFASGSSTYYYEAEHLKGIITFLSNKHSWYIIIDLFFIATIGGFYVVPLFAVLQYFSAPQHRSRIIAVNNLINSIFMVAATIILSILFYFGYSIPFAILLVSLMNMVVAFYIYKITPENEIFPFTILKSIFKFLFDKMYRVEVKNIENFYKAGTRVVIIANHISYIDPALLSVYLPERLTFAVNTSVSKNWWVRPFLKIVKALPIDPTNSMAIKTLIKEVRREKKIAIFPEGRITVTGSLMKVYEGPAMIADKSDAVILPIRIDGTQFTHFSKLKTILKIRLRPKVVITILPPVKFSRNKELDNREQRQYVGQGLYDIMVDMMFETSDYKNTLFQSLIEIAKKHGSNKEIFQDIENNSLTYRQLLLKSFVLSDLIAKDTAAEENVGLMLPNMTGTAIAFFAMQAIGRIPTMINFTSGPKSVVSGCRTACVKIVYTSHKFVEKANLYDIITKLEESSIKIIYFEDLKQYITLGLKLKSLIASFFPQSYYNNICENHNDQDPAVVLFTSGTEGVPKAVVLSHRNIQANRYQILAKVHFGSDDFAFNALPMFHCFGLTAMLLMSLHGVKTFLYPSPLHYRAIPEVIYDIGATIMFATDTFLNGYAQYANPYDFYSIRYIFAGAEKLKQSTRQLWFEKYGVRIFEGYGFTEASPVISANTSMHDRNGSVGRLLPRIEYHIEPVEGISDGGKLIVKGPNIMLGYMKSDNPGVIEYTYNEKLGVGWYDTGDIFKVDEDGYLTIIGRIKRFAKIAGEMVSLPAIEELAIKMDIKAVHATIQMEDNKKGEQILLFTTSKIITKETFAEMIKQNFISSLLLPKHIIYIEEIPVLSTGKIDYVSLTNLAKTYKF